MINNLLKIGVLYQLWKWLKPRFKLLSFAVATILLTWTIHSEYKDYLAQTNNSGYLGLSYFIKWVITFGVFIVFLTMDKLRLVANNKTIERSTSPFEADDHHSDPFENIRNKKKLDSHSDKFLKK